MEWKAVLEGGMIQDVSETGSSRKGVISGSSGNDFQQDVSTKVMATKTKNILVVDGNSLFIHKHISFPFLINIYFVGVCLYHHWQIPRPTVKFSRCCCWSALSRAATSATTASRPCLRFCAASRPAR